MATGSGKTISAARLEQLLIAAFGPDFRDLTIVGPAGSFHLEDAFEECGLEDPRRPFNPSSGFLGLWQLAPSRAFATVSPLGVFDPVRNAEAAIRGHYGLARAWATYSSEYSAYFKQPWPVSLGPSSPHGDVITF